MNDKINTAMRNLNENAGIRAISPIPYHRFLEKLIQDPARIVRNVFQVFHDMVNAYVGQGYDEYPEDPESINYISYDCTELFVKGTDHPFFADRLFANRFVNHIEALRRGAQQNKIYIFDGPHGCGKSTFLNNLLMKFEEYANTEAGFRWEVLWRLDRDYLGEHHPCELETAGYGSDYFHYEETRPEGAGFFPISESRGESQPLLHLHDHCIEVPCPSHDHPLLIIPKALRRKFLDDLLDDGNMKDRIFNDKEYDWVFRETACTICMSLYSALLKRSGNPDRVFEMIYARPYRFTRSLGEGISVYNPGDKPMRQTILTNPMLQRRINAALGDSNMVKYIFSRYAKTNNGIYSLMDIKSHNTERLMELHNIISEGVHKVEDVEENVNSLFLALMNPEDKKNVQEFSSFSDRIEFINISYVLDVKTEVEIYRNVFGKQIDDGFLPRVLHNFARVIISTRINSRSDALLEWIGSPSKYRRFCDENLQLLKMEIYAGRIPKWLSEEDLKRFTAKRRRRVLAESKNEGARGLSGRDAIKIFNEFYSAYARSDRLIDMSTLCHFFTKVRRDLNSMIPSDFLAALLRMYDYTILQEVKESLYYYNEEQIARDILNYLYAVNFEPGRVETSTMTGQRIEITEEFFAEIERRLLGARVNAGVRRAFREDVQKEYTSKTLTQEIMIENTPITETHLFESLRERYVHNLKEKVLDPFLENENFRQAIKDFGEDDFRTYDARIQHDVTFLMNNLCTKAGYTPQGAKEICMYVIDNDLARRFS